ncbi:hypothetical protein L9F63_006984 [Diploptera punctata]|uniref:C2H2-type domain-containing protein n=1 Tax=Diploptera punctata TaxID=6984 RepID=A0AAD8E4C8_DIPPU|nr:hypothetical protein L9F63_006984 [Diploptera punctata]
MDSQLQSALQETQMQTIGDDINSSTNVFDPCISGNEEGMQCGPENGLDFSLPQNTFTKADAMKNCGTWVDSQRQLQEARRSKRKRSGDEEDGCDSPDENELDGTASMVSSRCTNRQRPKYIRLKDEKLNLKCDWQDCDFTSTDVDTFVRHVSLHIPHLDVRMNEDNEGVYVCLWESCGFETSDSKEIVRHVNFHSYHTKIKCIGANVVLRMKFPPCTYDEDSRNLVPDLPDVFMCGWMKCDRIFNNSQMYFYHVQAHVMNNPRGKFIASGIPCAWRGCKSVFRTTYKLSDHVRTHTQEKVIGCPTCGGLFASRTKFFDHCKRQVPLELQGYQCSHCSKYYPSERLLRDHMRHHVNHYKCTFCDMTCPTPSSLGQHIRYRHLDSKPFKCDFCDYSAKSQYDMKHHVTTHYSEELCRCGEEGCGFSCRSTYALNKHYRKDHQGDDQPLYCCHICEEKFERGSILTKHLFSKHCFRWPSGHCRFRYKHEEDGYFRLQTVRYESLEVTQEMMQSECSGSQQPVCASSHYSLRRMNSSNDEPIMFTVSEDEDDPEEQPETGRSRILISIEEIDSCGNVVRSKVMEAEEVPTMPSGNVILIQDGGEVM